MIRDEQPNLTDQHGDAGFRWLLDRREEWGLTNSQLACLLGVSAETLLSWESQTAVGELVRASSDVVE
jgi:DNA-binding transcriptional regulator YiaG